MSEDAFQTCLERINQARSAKGIKPLPEDLLRFIWDTVLTDDTRPFFAERAAKLAEG